MSKKPTIRILVDETVPSAKGKAIRSSLRDVIVSSATKIIELETLTLGDRIIESFNAIKNIRMCLARKKLLVNTFIPPSRSFRFDFENFSS